MTEITLQAKHCWIDTTPENLGKNYGDFGIYILGIKNAQGRIVPYYVGQTSSNLSTYLIDKICEMKSPKTTWAIFSSNFHDGKVLNRNNIIQRVPNPGVNYPSAYYGIDLLYLNSGGFLQDSKVLGVQNWPDISKRGDLSIFSAFPVAINLYKDALSVQSQYFSPGKLFFCPITVVSNGGIVLGQYLKDMLKDLETFVKFSLIENTVGQSKTLKKMWQNLEGLNVVIDLPNIPCLDLKNEFYPTPR